MFTIKRMEQQTLQKQEYLDYESFIYNLKYWISFRRQALPLRTSMSCLSNLASTWNRSKIVSDVAMGIIRDRCYVLEAGNVNGKRF